METYYYLNNGHKCFGWDDLIDYLQETFLLDDKFTCYEEMATHMLNIGLIQTEDP